MPPRPRHGSDVGEPRDVVGPQEPDELAEGPRGMAYGVDGVHRKKLVNW